MVFKIKGLKGVPIKTDEPFKSFTLKVQDRDSAKNKSHITPTVYHQVDASMDMTVVKDSFSNVVGFLKGYEHGKLIIENGFEKIFHKDSIKAVKSLWAQFDDINKMPWNRETMNILSKLDLGVGAIDSQLDWTLKIRFLELIKKYNDEVSHNNETIKRNFAVKMLLLIKHYYEQLFGNFDKQHIPKVIYFGEKKITDSYFLEFLSSLGCDILCHDSVIRDIDLSVNTPAVQPQASKADVHSTDKKVPSVNSDSKGSTNTSNKPHNPVSTDNQIAIVSSIADITEIERTKKSLEDIAMLSPSVVMLRVYDWDFRMIGGGSGVVIDNEGLIATNYHVVNEGKRFGVLFEGDKDEYLISDIINYSKEADIALLRVSVKRAPIKMNYREQLKRGQEIVAIGSPLGLMNTISEGIISGFRQYGERDMIQISAPISAGSSGGALLNRYGELVGITTAGYDHGQNLNLAVPCSEIIKLMNS